MKRHLFILFLLIVICVTKGFSQSQVTEITWTGIGPKTYYGLLVLYPNNQGSFIVKFYDHYLGWITCHQDAVLTNRFDVFGNCTSVINCYYPKTTPNVPYVADNFIIYPNGAMYTQDAMGAWSTLITATAIHPIYWQTKFLEYGLK